MRLERVSKIRDYLSLMCQSLHTFDPDIARIFRNRQKVLIEDSAESSLILKNREIIDSRLKADLTFQSRNREALKNIDFDRWSEH